MGRHREFSPEQALDAALEVFWRQGFEGTSLADLTAATGVAAPGLYSAFGNKEAFFLKAVERYEVKYMGFMVEALAQPTAHKVIETMLRHNAKLLAGKSHPTGCLGVNGAVACSEASEPIRLELVRRRRASEAVLSERLRAAEAAGELPDGVSAEDLARFVMTVSQGMAVQAKAGASLKQLDRVIDLALIGIAERGKGHSRRK